MPKPTDIANAGDSRLFVVEQEGVIHIVQPDGTVLATPFLDIQGKVSCCGEQGLVGLVFHPDYASNGYFYVDYTDNASNIILARYEVSGAANVADPGSEQVILEIIHQPHPNHNGGDLSFGPDGFLYISVGDGAGINTNAQDGGVLLGKILRIDVNSGLPYSIPGDNPFVGDPTTLDEIWALGLRNPFRFSFDSSTGDMFVGDVGQFDHEEVDFEPAGSPGGINYGWKCYEGSFEFDRTDCGPISNYTFPIHEFDHDPACSVIGGFVYRGSQYPFLEGQYFFTDFCSADLWSLTPDGGGGWHLTSYGVPVPGLRPSSFGEDANGELYVAGRVSGKVYRLTAIPGCAESPLGSCRQPEATYSSLLLKNDPFDDLKDKLIWKWRGGDVTPKEAFGDPTPSGYSFCLYGGATASKLILAAPIPGGVACPSCWKETAKGFKYTDDGVLGAGMQKIQLKSGDWPGQAKIVLKGKGVNLPELPTVPVTLPLKVQLIHGDGACWEAAFSGPPKKNQKIFRGDSD